MADEAWTILRRIKVVARAMRFREVRIEAGDREDVAASKFPALVIRLLSLDENEDSSDDGVEHLTPIELYVFLSRNREAERVEEAIKLINDLKNAIEADTTLKKYKIEFEGAEFREGENPVEVAMVPMTATHYTTTTAR